MSESKDLPKKLPPMEKEIDLDTEGKMTKRQYKGQFILQIPNTKMRAKAAIKKAELNGGIKEEFLDQDVVNFHFMVAYLSAIIKEAPKWWRESENGYALHDANVVEELYSMGQDFEAKWIDEVWETPKANKKNEPKG
jgi:hypothetical protein